MTILVTGGAGYVGSQLAHELIDAGERLVVIDDLSRGFAEALPKGAALIVGDCGDRGLLEKVMADHAVDEIMHFAASVVVPESMRSPLRYYRNNTVNTLTLIEVAAQRKVRHIVYSSTAAVYGSPERQPIAEDAATVPLSPYGQSKLMGERMLADASGAHDFRFIALRYFNVAGADPRQRTGPSTRDATHLIKVAVQTALGLRPRMEIFGTDYPTADGTCVRDYIHVADLARVHLDALRHLRAGGGSATLNCGYGHGVSVRQVIETVKRRSGRDFRVDVGPRRAGDASSTVASCERLRAMLRWQPRYDSLDLIVDHALAWERRLAPAANSASAT